MICKPSEILSAFLSPQTGSSRAVLNEKIKSIQYSSDRFKGKRVAVKWSSATLTVLGEILSLVPASLHWGSSALQNCHPLLAHSKEFAAISCLPTVKQGHSIASVCLGMAPLLGISGSLNLKRHKLVQLNGTLRVRLLTRRR